MRLIGKIRIRHIKSRTRHALVQEGVWATPNPRKAGGARQGI